MDALNWYCCGIINIHTLQDLGFELNPYGLCVANKTIDGSQCTIIFYVDDNKISHRDSKVVDGIIELLKKEFGNVTYSRGKQHDFLGMDVSFTENKIVSIHMKNQIEEAIDWLNENIPQNASTPANKNCFRLNIIPQN